MEMNTKPRLHQSLAFNLIVAVAIGVCFGARPGVAQSDPRSISGEWSTGPTWPFLEFPVHAHLLPTGKVMIWPGDQHPTATDQQPRSWDPATGSISTLATPGYDVFCSGHSLLADGKLFVAGGHDPRKPNGVGLANASIYNPDTGTPATWTALPDMTGVPRNVNDAGVGTLPLQCWRTATFWWSQVRQYWSGDNAIAPGVPGRERDVA